METITRDELQRRLDHDDELVLVEVLSPGEYSNWHLPGAINVPLDETFEDRAAQAIPDRESEVVVYCSNTNCPASRQAARKLDALGYARVFDYEAGKEDWQDAELPVESGTRKEG